MDAIKRNRLIAAIYVPAFLITFGYEAANPSESPNCIHRMDKSFCTVTDALAAGAFWPLYWTWEAAEYLRSTPQR